MTSEQEMRAKALRLAILARGDSTWRSDTLMRWATDFVKYIEDGTMPPAKGPKSADEADATYKSGGHVDAQR